MKIYVVRHGESQTNKSMCYTGYFNSPLTDKGREDAKFAREVLSGISFDRVFSSDLDRAVETCKIATGREPETDALLREIDVGSLENIPYESLSREERTNYFKIGYAHFGGESKEDFKIRIKSFMDKLEALECDNVAVFSHGAWLISLICMVLGVDSLNNILCANCAVGVFDYSNGRWMLHSLINK